MSDLIRRQDAIDMVRQYCIDNQIEDGDYHSDGIEYELNNLPSAQQWIPCSERLPEEGHLVLTTIRGTDFILLREKETLEDAIERTQKMLRVSCGFWGEDGWYGSDGYPEIVKPIAWMPLPEPWKGEQE